MPRKMIVLLITLVVSFLSASCGDDNESNCTPYGSGTIGTCTNVQACCEGTTQQNMQCWYQSGSRRWDCDGSNCQAAATKLIQDCQGS